MQPAAVDWAWFDRFDFLLVKSNWHWQLDEAFRAFLAPRCAARAALLVSGTLPPPPHPAPLAYDALLYETEWYRPQARHIF